MHAINWFEIPALDLEGAGGKVLTPEMNLGKFGFSAIIHDSEGNRIGLLSNEA
jgi:predicted enzyme related to lactoylglutathione lyase